MRAPLFATALLLSAVVSRAEEHPAPAPTPAGTLPAAAPTVSTLPTQPVAVVAATTAPSKVGGPATPPPVAPAAAPAPSAAALAAGTLTSTDLAVAPAATPPAPDAKGTAAAPPAAPVDENTDGSDSDMDDVQAADAIGIQEDVNAGKKELEDLKKAESQIIDHADTGPQHVNRFGPGNPLQARTVDANRGGDLFDAAQPTPEGDAGSVLAELNGLDLAALKAEFDIPVEINDDVLEYIRFFQGPGRLWYSRWLARSHRWIPIMRPILAEEGAPLDLVYLAMIESGFSPFAYSWARASGFWQFISETGRRYGLRDDFWVDERRDPMLSTRAAARYLKQLHNEFGDWYLAWASYNAGEGKLRKAVKLYNSHDFWEIAHAGKFLRKETKHYVPKLIAAAIIAKHPERFGFTNVEEEGPFAFDNVEVSDATDLAIVARATGMPIDALQQMNPSLRRWCTPPARDGKGYQIKVPPGTREAFLADVNRLEPSDQLTFRYHRVAPGESVAAVAKKFSTAPEGILRMNGIPSAAKLKAGTDLIVPISSAAAGKFPDLGLAWKEPGGRHRHHGRVVASGSRVAAPVDHSPRASHASASGEKYVVRGGDSLWSIARHFGVEVDELQRWNNLGAHSTHGLQVGKALRLSAPRKAEAATPRKGRG